LPHVQAGCHGYAHPLVWRDKVPGYAIAGYEMTYEQEVRGAVEYLNRNVLPPDKPVEVYQWSGDCDPPEEPLAILAEMGLPNINGGDSRYDSRFNSVYYISPLSRPEGRYRQIYTAGANENIYTEGWTGFKGAFNNVVETFERSENPRRLLPVNIYFHVFPAEAQAGLRAIRNAFDWASLRELCWIRAVEYVRAVEGFLRARVGRTGDGGWWVEGYGACPSLRFDGEQRFIDMERSRNVAGYVRNNNSLYVSLLPGERAEVRFTEDARLEAPCLARASGMLSGVKRAPGRWEGRIRTWGPGFIELWAPEGEWRVLACLPNGGGTLQGTMTPLPESGDTSEETEARLPEGVFSLQGMAARLPDGRVRFDLPDAGGEEIEVTFEH